MNHLSRPGLSYEVKTFWIGIQINFIAVKGIVKSFAMFHIRRDTWKYVLLVTPLHLYEHQSYPTVVRLVQKPNGAAKILVRGLYRLLPTLSMSLVILGGSIRHTFDGVLQGEPIRQVRRGILLLQPHI